MSTERKVVTTLFADLVGFTALGERHDPEDVDAALRGYYALARTIIERFGGVVEKYIGDAVVGLFGGPLAHEDDAERAVRAALEIVAHLHELPVIGDERLQVRAAVNTGPALVRLHARPGAGEGALVGDAVNTASRLLAEAPPMGVVVGEMTQRLTSRAIVYEGMAARSAKGKAKPIERWLARGPIAQWGTAIAPSATPMIGREVELGVLLGLLDKAIASRSPQYALIEGEAGLGKTRLVREMLRRVDERPDFFCTWRQGRCPAYGDGLAFWALGEIVAGHAGILQSDGPEAAEEKLEKALGDGERDEWLLARLRPLVGLPAPQIDRDDAFAAWLQFVLRLARVRPTVLVFEDVH
ncbi:MAG: adenylate/guanylate cyclase domain-containing protein, partial [Actinomycetes bacterium]